MDMDIHSKQKKLDLFSLDNFENLSNLVINKIANNRLVNFELFLTKEIL